MKSVPEKDATLLGSVLSSTSATDVLTEKLTALKALQRRITSLRAHYALFFLRHSLAIPRLLYTLRTSPCGGGSLLSDFGDVLRACLSEVLNIQLDDVQ